MERTHPAPGSRELERLRRRHAELEILYETVRDLTSTLAVQEVLDRLLERTLRHLQSELGSILLLEDGRLRIVSARGLPEQVVEQTRVRLGEGISGFVAESGRPLLVQDVEADPRFARRNRERYYTHSLISTPLRLRDEVSGVLNVNNKSSRQNFDAEDLQLLEAIAGHAAIALANAQRYEETLRRAQRDALTGLANHGHFYAMLEQEVERARRYGRSLALAMIDIDHFKAYNDRFGHPEGDEALVRVARSIASHSRMHDHAARYGGEEFAVILPETDLEGARIFGEKVRGVVADACAVDDEKHITVSIGVCAVESGGESAAQLVENADAALYRAKALGRNRVCSVPDAAD